jgi:transcriptional regulator with GAF, ATPase, and Fis domain
MSNPGAKGTSKPRLIALSGPLEGGVIPLTAAEVAVGRESANQIHLPDLSVSRRHCVIKPEGDGFTVTDLDSFNGTAVNGVPVKERALTHGDRLTVGNSQFLFLLHEGEPPPASGPVQLDEGLDEGREVTQMTVRLRAEDVLYLQPEKVVAALPPTARLARDLNALLKISTAVNSVRGLDALQRQLLELLFEVVPAERGAILLLGERAASREQAGGAGQAGDGFASVFGWDRAAGAGRAVQVSRTVVRQVLKDGAALLTNDLSEAESPDSLIASEARSLLVVPLAHLKQKLGVIYLSTSDPVVWFDEDHLQLVTAIASIAAVAVENVRHVEGLERENRRLTEEINIERNMVGESKRMREVYGFIAKVAPTDSTVLIRGESGTGKELAARAIHLNSPRAAKPFVAINCAALTETLLESELFGHEKGAFTGAVAQKKGKLEVADGGTVFLDELGEMPMPLQIKLLRVLQEQEFERVGGTRPIKVDIRLIAATNRDLEAAIKDGSFRHDLYYRLNVVALKLPPLRERREDIPLLSSAFAAKYAAKCKRQIRGISAEARACLQRYDWPGNVRELENAIERAVVLGSGDLIEPEDLPEVVLENDAGEGSAAATEYHEAVKETKKQLILKACAEAGGSYVEAAKLLGLHPNYLHRLIRNLNLKSLLKGEEK